MSLKSWLHHLISFPLTLKQAELTLPELLYFTADFFETSAMLITFILLGKYLEAAAKSRTSAAITRLLQLTPPTAILLTLDGKGNVASEQELATSLVHRGDLLKVLLLLTCQLGCSMLTLKETFCALNVMPEELSSLGMQPGEHAQT